MKRLVLFLSVYLLFSTQTVVHSEVTLPRVISSNMVLQRDMQAPIWGMGISRRRYYHNAQC